MPQFATPETVVPFRWTGKTLEVLDQRLLPGEERWNICDGADAVYEAIASMQVRGAPAIGIAAAYGVVLAAREAVGKADWKEIITTAMRHLRESRPTAVNLFWALDRMSAALGPELRAEAALEALEEEAQQIHSEDHDACVRMGALGCDLIAEQGAGPFSVLTHCNTGALATGGHGTALGVIRTLSERRQLREVFVDETRPWLQGSRLTAWELAREGIPHRLNADSAAATLLASGEVSWVVVGADRIAANGDVANKIGTLPLAVLARHYGVGFMVVAPSSTVDMQTASGADIAIEEREAAELCYAGERRVAPEDTRVFNPVFDVTPANLIDAIVTDRGVIRSPSRETMKAFRGDA